MIEFDHFGDITEMIVIYKPLLQGVGHFSERFPLKNA